MRTLAALAAVALCAVPARAEGLRGRLIPARPADLEGTVVWVEEGAGLPPLPSSPATRAMSQINKRFSPRALAVRAGDRVDFENLDNVFHNVFSLDKEGRFDLGLFKGKRHFAADLKTELKDPGSTIQPFPKSGRFHVFCNIHPDMEGAVFVFSHGYFAQSDREGLFALPPLPPGSYTVGVDGPLLPKPIRTPVRVDAGTVLLEVPLAAARRAAPPVAEHPRKDGTPYPSRRRY